MGQYKLSCPKQVFWPKIPKTFFGTHICSKPILGHPFVQNCPMPIFGHLFVHKYFKAPICPNVPKAYFEAPICPKVSKIYFRHPFVQNLFWDTDLSKTIQNLFWGTFLSKTYCSKSTQILFKDFEGYNEKASNLVFCYWMFSRSSWNISASNLSVF